MSDENERAPEAPTGGAPLRQGKKRANNPPTEELERAFKEAAELLGFDDIVAPRGLTSTGLSLYGRNAGETPQLIEVIDEPLLRRDTYIFCKTVAWTVAHFRARRTGGAA